MKKQKWLKLGVIATITPVVTVVSCGINKYATSDQQKLYNELTSPTALRILENQWQYKVLTNFKDPADTANPTVISKYTVATKFDLKGAQGPTVSEVQDQFSPNFANKTVQAIAVAILQKNINSDKDGTYITNLSNTLLQSGSAKYDAEVPGLTGATPKVGDKVTNIYTQDWMTANGLMSYLLFHHDWKYDFSPTPGTLAPNTMTLKGLKLLLSDNRLTFKTDLLKALVSYAYLNGYTASDNIKQLDKNAWAAVNVSANRDLTDIDQAIDPAKFPLVREEIAKKYFGSWKIQLPEDASLQYINTMKNGLLPTDALQNMNIANMSDDTKLVSQATYTEERTLSTNNVYNFGAIDGVNFSSVVNYQGIASQNVGPDHLKFTLNTLEDAKDASYYQGFLAAGKDKADQQFVPYSKTAPTKVKVFTTGSDQATLDLLQGIMPVYQNGNLTIDAAKQAGDSRFMAAYDQDVYTAAKKYYVTQVKKKGSGDPTEKDAVILEFNKNSAVQRYKKILEQKFHIDFLEAKDPS